MNSVTSYLDEIPKTLHRDFSQGQIKTRNSLSRSSSVTSIERLVVKEETSTQLNEKGRKIKRTIRLIRVVKRTVGPEI